MGQAILCLINHLYQCQNSLTLFKPIKLIISRRDYGKNFHQIIIYLQFLPSVDQLIILKMDNYENSLRIQLRIERCTLKIITVPANYSFILINDHFSSSSTSWKQPENNNILHFNCFLKLKVPNFTGDLKCILQFFSRSDGHISLVGTANITFNQSKCNRLRKYPIKRQGETLAIIQASLFMKNNQNSLPNFSNISSDISSQSNYSTISMREASIETESILSHLKTTVSPLESRSNKQQISKKLNIVKGLQITVDNSNFGAQQAQNLLANLFVQIAKKNEQISKKQAFINEKQTQIQHIRMRQMVFKKDQKKIQRLKNQSRFLIAANQVLINKDQRYDEQYFAMKEEKADITKKMASISSQSSLKIMCLKSQLQQSKKKLEVRDKKVNTLLQQILSYTRQINILKEENKERTKIISNLKNDLNQYQLKQGDQRLNFLTTFIDELLHPKKQMDIGEKQVKLIPSFQRSNHMKACTNEASTSNDKFKKYKSLSLFKPATQRLIRTESKQKFSKSKLQTSQQGIQIPNILEFLLNMQNYDQ